MQCLELPRGLFNVMPTISTAECAKQIVTITIMPAVQNKALYKI